MRGEYPEMITRELDAAGVAHSFDIGGKHAFAAWKVNGEPRSFYFPLTPSDVRGVHNSRSDLRKMLRADGLIAIDEVVTLDRAYVFPKGGAACCSSLDIAANFGKAHKDVLRSIDKAADELGREYAGRIFTLSEFRDGSGRTLRCFNLTRDGFALIAMGFTGASAMQWKRRYLDAFNAMESELVALGKTEIVARLQFLEGEVKALSELICETPAIAPAPVVEMKAAKAPFIARRSVIRKLLKAAA